MRCGYGVEVDRSDGFEETLLIEDTTCMLVQAERAMRML